MELGAVMSKESLMIPIDAEALRNAIQKRGSIASLEEPLDVTRQAINGWLSSSRIPPRKLQTIAKNLKLSPDEVESIVNKEEKLTPLFRTLRNIPAPQESKRNIEEIARDFFVLNSIAEQRKSVFSIHIKTNDPAVLAEHILKELNLDRSRLSLDQLILSLESLQIYVLFVKFDLGLPDTLESKTHAFCVQKNSSWAIFVDSNRPLEDVMWAILHELAHIFSGHNGEVTKQDEDFCNRVANQVLTPDSFFVAHQKALKSKFEKSHAVSVYHVDDLAKTLRSSFVGVLLSLEKHKIISKALVKYLWAVHHRRKKFNPTVKDLIFAPEEMDPVKFWASAFNDPERVIFLKLQLLVKLGLSTDRISIARAAELIGIDELAMQQLAVMWKDNECETSH